MSIYADTSVFFSLYVPDIHSAEAHRSIEQHQMKWLTPLHEAEWVHALYQHVFTRQISAKEATLAEQAFLSHKAMGVWRVVPLPDVLFPTCIDLARRYAARLGMRTLDTLHVAAALEFSAERFWTFDERQAKLARAAGLKLV